MNKKFYITTPIYYINDVPHIGHTCTTVAADIVARLHRQKGDEVFFLTGTDEHGQKVAEVAEKEGLETKTYCDKIAPRFADAWKLLNISNDFFIRTTDLRHEAVVTEVLKKIYEAGDVYKDKYEGYYCVGCEKFVTESELVEKHCPIHPPEKTVWQTEENWFFRLSKYVPKLIELIEDDQTNYIFPEGKKSEVLAKLRGGVKDVSISREKVKWGIPAPWDTKHTIYVWIDALINYYSATKFVEGKENFWPASIHLLGKEILWFHTVIWQAMLLSAGIPLPQRTYTHSFYIIDGQKMSKSLGNVISPGQLVDLFGADGARYLIARSFPTDNDADVGIERFKERYNADLANNLGNLISRVNKLKDGLKVNVNNCEFDAQIDELINNFQFDQAISLIFSQWIDSSNNLLNQVEPWKLEKNDPKRIEVLETCQNNIAQAVYHLKPIIPTACDKIITGFEGSLFPRVN